MVIKNKFGQTPQRLVNFSVTDILTDRGFLRLYGMKDLANNYTLVPSSLIEADEPFTEATGSSPLTNEANFDYTFETPAQIEGNLYVTITIAAKGTAGDTANNATTIEVFHYDGSTETTIGTEQSLPTLQQPGVGTSNARHTAVFNISRTAFEKGDILRIEVRSTFSSATVGDSARFYHDPPARDFSLTDQWGATTSSDLIVMVPFPLED